MITVEGKKFVLDRARRLYEDLDARDIIGRAVSHGMSQEEIEDIISFHLRTFLLEHWPDAGQL